MPAWHKRVGHGHCLNTNVVWQAWDIMVAGMPLCRMSLEMLLPGCSVLFIIQAAITGMIKLEINIYICNSWEKPISFAPVRNNVDLLVSLTNWLSIYIVMYLHDPNHLGRTWQQNVCCKYNKGTNAVKFLYFITRRKQLKWYPGSNLGTKCHSCLFCCQNMCTLFLTVSFPKEK